MRVLVRFEFGLRRALVNERSEVSVNERSKVTTYHGVIHKDANTVFH